MQSVTFMVKVFWQRLRISVGWCKSRLPEVSTAIRKKSNTSIRQSTRSANESTGRHVISRHTPFNQTQIAIALTIILLTAILGQRFYNQPALTVGTVAEETYIAPYNATLPDMITTEANRQAARSGSSIVLQIDQEKTETILEEADGILTQGTLLRQQAGKLPYLSTAQLSSRTQRYLRQTSGQEWEEIWGLAQSSQITDSILQTGTSGTLQVRLNNLDDEQRIALNELVRLRERTSPESMSAVRSQVNASRQQYLTTKPKLQNVTTRSNFQPLDLTLFELSDESWKAVQASSRLVLTRMLTQGIHDGTSAPLWQQAIDVQLQGTLDLSAADNANRDELAAQEALAKDLSSAIISSVLQPNLIEDTEQTRLRAEQVENEVQTVTVSIERGSPIVNNGETITQGDFVLLDHFNLTQRRFNWLGFAGFGTLVSACIGLLLWVDHWQAGALRQRDHLLILCLIISVAGLMALKIPGLGLPAIGLLLGSFYGYILATVTIGLLVIPSCG